MTAEILSWSRSRGVFAGIALEGATLRGDDDANLDLYGTAPGHEDDRDGRHPGARLGAAAHHAAVQVLSDGFRARHWRD